jgi:hypothetical protein
MVQRLPALASWVSSLVQVGVLAHSLLWGGVSAAVPTSDATPRAASTELVLAQADQDALDAQLATAIQHAEFSMSAEDPAMATRHLGHVLNCIVGEGGEGFDGAWGHPCAGQGEGILRDAEAHPHVDAVMLLVRSARDLAQVGVQSDAIAAVHAAAAGVRGLLMALVDFRG